MPVTRKKFPACPVERTLAVLSGRWKAMVVWHLLNGRKRYSEIFHVVPGISERVLTQVLRELADDGVVHKTDDQQWQLTQLGSGLIVAIAGMYAWGSTHANALPER